MIEIKGCPFDFCISFSNFTSSINIYMYIYTLESFQTQMHFSNQAKSPNARRRSEREMGRAPCCDKANVKKGPWSPEEDSKLKDYIEKYGTGGNWIALPQKAGN